MLLTQPVVLANMTQSVLILPVKSNAQLLNTLQLIEPPAHLVLLPKSALTTCALPLTVLLAFTQQALLQAALCVLLVILAALPQHLVPALQPSTLLQDTMTA